MNTLKPEFSTKSRAQIQAHLVEKATANSAFRAALISDPRSAIEDEIGLSIPAGIQLLVVEEKPDRLCLVLPAVNGELSDLELEGVAGGSGNPICQEIHGMGRSNDR